jgi:hypothetical protein
MMASNYQHQGKEEEDSCELQVIAASVSDCSSLSGESLQDSVVACEKKTHRISVFLKQLALTGDESEHYADRSTRMTDPLHLGFLRLFDLPSPIDSPAREIKQDVMLDTSEFKDVHIKPNTMLSCDTQAASEVKYAQEQTSGSKKDLREDQSDETATSTSTDHSTVKTEEKPPPTFMETLQFEALQTGTAVPAFVCYCISHLIIYELIYGALLELTDLRVKNVKLLYLGLMAAGLSVLRCTGFLWHFLPARRYRRSRREMKQRQPWDASVAEWLEEAPAVKTTLNVFGFYLCYISVYFFWNWFISRFVDQREELFKLLPSTQYYERVVRDSFGVLAESTNDMSDGSCDVSHGWDVADYEFLYANVAKTSYYQFKGSSTAPLYSLARGAMVFISAAALSIYFLFTVGFEFFDGW